MRDGCCFCSLYGSGVEVKSGTNGWPFLSLAWIGDGLGDARSDVEYFQYRVKFLLLKSCGVFPVAYKSIKFLELSFKPD